MLRLILMSVLAASASGCATQGSWAPAIDTTARFSYLPGPALSAMYLPRGGDLYWVAIGTDHFGRVPADFDYTGPRAKVGDIWSNVSDDRLTALRNAADRSAANSTQPTAAPPPNPRPVVAADPTGRVIAVLYRIDPDGRIVFIRPPSGRSNWEQADPIPPDALIALLPGAIDRSSSVVFGYRLRAVLETPIDLLIDLTILPVLDAVSKMR